MLDPSVGCGILDDVPSFALLALMEQIDQNGCTDEPAFYNECETPWDYCHFYPEDSNTLLKHQIRFIQDAYENPWDDE